LAAHEQLNEGVDVAVGIVETHRRPETEKLLQGLPFIPQLEVDHRGVSLREFNLDAALKRKPAILLVDELAHTNAPGLRHPKRWNDIEELLDAGIDVYTTLNVQHIESLSDLVAGATGVVVKETIPDSVFDAADDIVLVDLNVDDLLKRLREGKVYIAERARERAADNFFKKGNLIALRELALRRTAERIDAQRDEYDYREGTRERAPIADKIMVCIGPDPLSAKLVRTAKRFASSFKAPWVAVYIENARHYRLNERGQRALRMIFRLVERIGGKAVVLQGDANVADEIVAYARANRITKIIVGRPVKSFWRTLLSGSLSNKIINKSGDVDVYIVTGEPGAQYESVFGRSAINKFKFRLYGWSFFVAAIATAIGIVARGMINPSDQALIYLTGVVIVAARCGMGPAMLYAFLSASCLDFFFIEPLYSFSIYDRAYWTTLTVIVMTGFVIANQASRLRLQAILSRKRELNTQTLYALTRGLASTRGDNNIAATAARHIAGMLDVEVTIWLPRAEGQLSAVIGDLPRESYSKENGALLWCFDNGKLAGRGTDTMPTASGFYLPLLATTGVLGVLGVIPRSPEPGISAEEKTSLETIAALLAASLERAKAAEIAERSVVEAETERLRNTLLSSVSHDLRTPLASITGASSSIVMDLEKLAPATVRDLARSIQHEASRLSRIVANLLDITTLESGSVRLNRQPYFVQEIVGAALMRAEPVLDGHILSTQAADDLPMALVDGALIEQVLQNLLENAAYHTPSGSAITVSAAIKDGDILICVGDDGPGIPKGEEEKIFDKFYTISRRGFRKGTGLGLAICASILKAHGRRIWAENRPEGGAIFRFTLPVADKTKLGMPHDPDA
jgi:two-component system sensor histidine kinase KdpD